MTQAHVGSSHLSLVIEPYKYSLRVRVRVSMALDGHLPPRERNKERVKSFFLPKPIIWSVKVMIGVIGQKTLGIRDLHKLQASFSSTLIQPRNIQILV